MQKFMLDSKKEPVSRIKTGKIISLIAGEAAILLLGGILLGLITTGAGTKPTIYMDGLSLLPIVGMVFIVLTATGLLREFGHAFVYCVEDDYEVSAAQVRRAAYSIKLSMVTALLTGAVTTVVWLIGLLYSPLVGQTEFYPLLFADSVIGILYGMIAVILLIPIYASLKIKVLTKE